MTLFAALAVASLLCGSAIAQPSPVVDGETIATSELVKAACTEGQIAYYTAQNHSNELAIVASFEKLFPCVKVSVISAVTGQLYERIQTEAKVGKTLNDVAIITDEALAERMVAAKLVRPWTPPSASLYPENAKLAGWWYAASGAVMYPVYNPELVKAADVPKSWRDLLDAKWKGKLGTSPVTLGGTAWMVYAFLTAKFGAPYIAALAAQEPKLYTTYGLVVLAVERGEMPLGVVSSLDEYSHRMDGAPIKPIYPVEGVPFTNYPMMVMTAAPHPAAAELFANWYLSKAGQSSLVRVRGVTSARPDVAPAPGNPPLAELKPWNPGRDAIVRDHDALIDDVSKAFGRR